MSNIDTNKEIKDLQLMEAQKLPMNDQLYVVANLLGYKEYPVDIITFLDDPYYMGNVSRNLYPIWRDELSAIFPTPIHTSTPILVFTGALGTGKSTAVRFAAEYLKYRLLCLKNVYDTCGFVPGKNIKFSWFHKTGLLAQTDFVDVIDKWEEMSPFFSDAISEGRLNIYENSCDSVRSNNNIGSDVIFFNYSELNFIPYDKAHEKLDSGLKRWTSRYEMLLNYFGLCVIDTSAQGDDSIADDFIASNPYGSKVRSIYTNRWKVREHLHYYGQHGWFKVYIGDSTHQPFIVRDGMPLPPDLDPDRFMEIPEECRGDFEYDLVTALQDIAGISISKSDKFIIYPDKIRARAVLPQYSDNVVKFDFYDKTDKLIYRFDRSIRSIPSDRVIFIRFDTAVVGDNCGLAIAYFEKWKSYELGSKVKIPLIKVPLAVGINRYEEQETSLDHIYEFILDLNNRFEIGDVSFDQYQSRMILQNLTRDKINNRYLSVDRTDEAYVYLKTLAYNGGLELPLNELLLKEICELKRIGNKCDHPSTGCFIADTRVICRSTAGSVITITIGNLINEFDQYDILSYNLESKSFEFVKINKVWITKRTSKLIEIQFEDYTKWYCTPDHRILTTKGYKAAIDLISWDYVVNYSKKVNKKLKVKSVKLINLNTEVPVYDIEVNSDNHNFCLANGTVVHNSKDISDAVAGCVFDLYQNIELAGQLSTKYKVNQYVKQIEDKSKSSDSVFQDMIQGIFQS